MLKGSIQRLEKNSKGLIKKARKRFSIASRATPKAATHCVKEASSGLQKSEKGLKKARSSVRIALKTMLKGETHSLEGASKSLKKLEKA